MPSFVRALGAVSLALGAHAADLPAQSAPPAATELAGEPRTLQVNGETRRYFLYVPASAHHGRAAPLVLVFHGGGGRAAGIAPHTGFSRLAEREGFVAVYPEGVGGRWNDGRGYAATHDDVGFIRALLETLGRELGTDARRVYATGISNGAMFSYRLACDLPGAFAAVAPVAGAMPADLVPSCAHTAPVSVIAFQGTADPLMPYAGGESRSGAGECCRPNGASSSGARCRAARRLRTPPTSLTARATERECGARCSADVGATGRSSSTP